MKYESSDKSFRSREVSITDYSLLLRTSEQTDLSEVSLKIVPPNFSEAR